jgi:hypothetical protein
MRWPYPAHQLHALTKGSDILQIDTFQYPGFKQVQDYHFESSLVPGPGVAKLQWRLGKMLLFTNLQMLLGVLRQMDVQMSGLTGNLIVLWKSGIPMKAISAAGSKLLEQPHRSASTQQ